LTQTESKHPLKEQYDRLFTDRTVLWNKLNLQK
jgi:hypothetical protein